jgi:hypothetical protein
MSDHQTSPSAKAVLQAMGVNVTPDMATLTSEDEMTDTQRKFVEAVQTAEGLILGIGAQMQPALQMHRNTVGMAFTVALGRVLGLTNTGIPGKISEVPAEEAETFFQRMGELLVANAQASYRKADRLIETKGSA